MSYTIWDNHTYVSPVPGTPTIEGLERHRKAGFTVAMLNLGDAAQSLEHILGMAAFVTRWLEENSDRFLPLRDITDITRAKEEAKLAVGFDVEGAYAVDDDLDNLALLQKAGVRWMSFVYNRQNRAGSGVHDETDEGLTPFGVRLAQEMDRIGMIKCLSHTGYRTAMDVLSSTSKPCIFSHSNALALKSHARNIPDELIRACASTNGVVCVNGIDIFLGDEGPAPRLMARHIDYVAQLVGVDHVGIGFDYGYADADELPDLLSDSRFWPEGNEYDKLSGCVPPEAVADLIEILQDIGYTNAEVGKVLGGNLLRVARSVWPGGPQSVDV